MYNNTTRACDRLEELVRDVEYDLMYFANAMDALGMMPNVVTGIKFNVQRLNEMVAEIRSARNEDMDDLIKHSHQNSLNILNTALAATAIGSGDPKQVKEVEKFIEQQGEES